MCVVCVEWAKGKMTANEALRAIGEMAYDDNDPDHVYYLLRDIVENQEES